MNFVKMDSDETPPFCMTKRFSMASWGYSKIVIDIILMVLIAERTINVFYSPFIYDVAVMVTFLLLLALVMTDIVIQAKLIHGLRKNKVKLLIAYSKYTKVLWVLMPLSFVLFTLIWVTGFMGPSFWRYDRDNRVLTILCTMLIGTILQSLIMMVVIKEIKNLKGEIDKASTSSGGIRLFGFIIKIETSCSEKLKEDDNNKTYMEDTNEKAKLPV